METKDTGKVRTFASGATRDTAENKLEPWGFISPLALHRFSVYMNKHRFQSDGTLRASDNWQKGIPIKVYVHSLIRHVMDFWLVTAGFKPRYDKAVTDPVEIACAIMFNLQGYMHEMLKANEEDEQKIEVKREWIKVTQEEAQNAIAFDPFQSSIPLTEAEIEEVFRPLNPEQAGTLYAPRG